MTNLMFILKQYACGSGDPLVVDALLPDTISKLVSIMKVAIPIMVVIFGLIDLGKAVMSAKEDDIKKNQGLLIKRVIIAVLVFFVVSIVQLVINLVGSKDDKYSNCFQCFINGECNEYTGE